MQVRAFLILVLLTSASAFAQGNSPATGPAMSQQDPCRHQVSKFEQSIGFVRQNAGQKAATDLKERLLPAKTESEILFKDGYCGLAKYLKNHKLVD